MAKKKLACTKCGGTKMPKYSNDPRTEQGRILKKGGSVATKDLPEAGLGSIIKGGYKLLKGADKVKKIKNAAKTVKGKIVKPKKPKTFAEKRKMVAERNDVSLKTMGKTIGKALLYSSVPLGAQALWIASEINKENKRKGKAVKQVIQRSKKPTIKSSAAPRTTKKK